MGDVGSEFCLRLFLRPHLFFPFFFCSFHYSKLCLCASRRTLAIAPSFSEFESGYTFLLVVG